MAKQLNPIFSIAVPSPVTSLCFTAPAGNSNKSSSETKYPDNADDNLNDEEYDDEKDESENDSSDGSSEGFQFRSAQLVQQRQDVNVGRMYHDPQLMSQQSLTSCHSDGTLRLWDLNRRIAVAEMLFEGGPGLSVRRLSPKGGENQPISPLFLYHRRDPNGTVSIIDATQGKVVQEFQSRSQNFCAASPCYGDDNLLAVPSTNDSTVTVMDRRDQRPAYVLPIKDKGMLSSLAIGIAGESQKTVLVCGMENGSVLFNQLSYDRSHQKHEINLSQDPVLTVDMTTSSTPASQLQSNDHDDDSSKSKSSSSIIVAAGMAGDASEINELPADQQGRIALLKATHHFINDDWNVKIRARMSTCRVNDDTSFGKPGVSICRFRPIDGRLLAVGGWDHRTRIFDRSTGRPMAILKGHEGSMNSLDWAPNSVHSGLLASAGADDNRIYMWKCFSNVK
ncbi:unnamed protein product [Cylindrotheca closterium]|uniref:Uncharacterized protein n=1 Tax=Cylindrotheca closterium TaxID=2856 RepID=A0AAD2CEF4_9STRA|nr:unnamed protein product [Cylindrotheca closterium]